MDFLRRPPCSSLELVKYSLYHDHHEKDYPF